MPSLSAWRSWRRPSVLLNSVLVLLLLTAVVGAVLLLDEQEVQAAPDTTEVTRGQVISQVSATGNVVSARDVGVDFATGGRLTEVFVAEGDRVRRGQVLARVDSAAAVEEVDSARAALRQARGQLAQLVAGPSDADLAAGNASVAQAQTSVETARQALTDARRVAATARTVYDDQVRRAERAVDAASGDLLGARDDLAAAQRELRAAHAAEDDACTAGQDGTTGPGTTACSTAQTRVSSAEQAVTTAEQEVSTADQTLDSARDAWATARQNRATGLAQQTQSVNSAQSSLESARASYDYTVATARQQLEGASTGEVETAQGQVDAAEVTLRSAERALRETELRAPASGVVDSVSARRGEYVGGGGGSGGTSATATTSTDGTQSSESVEASGFVVITNVRGLQVQADFSEADVSRLRLGQGASVSFEALPEVTVNATVTSIATSSVVQDNVVTYQVEATLEDAPRKIRVGQTASVGVVLDEAADVLVVPSSAVTTTGTASTVSVHSGGETTTRHVEVGVVGDSLTEVVSGLEEGDRVVTSSGAGSGGFPSGGIPDLPGGGLGGGL